MHISFFYIIVCAFLADGSLLNHRITSEPTVAWLHIIGLLKLQSTKPSLQGSTPKENLKAREYCQGYDNLACAIVHGRNRHVRLCMCDCACAIVHGRNRKLFQKKWFHCSWYWNNDFGGKVNVGLAYVAAEINVYRCFSSDFRSVIWAAYISLARSK